MWADGFRYYFTPLCEVLFTFPSRYLFTIGLSVIFSLTGWSPLIHSRFLVSRVTQVSSLCVLIFRLRGYHALWRDFPNPSTIFIHMLVKILLPLVCLNKQGLGCSPFARHYLGNHCCFLFLWVLRCFSSPRSPFLLKVPELLSGGLPHSEICGSRRMCQSPQLIAAYHVLLRSREPRHPPSAFSLFLRPDIHIATYILAFITC